MGDAEVVQQDALLLYVIQPKPFELVAVPVGELSFMDPRSRLITSWLRGVLHTSTLDGTYLEWWDREQDGELIADRQHYIARSGDVIVEWLDGTFQVISQREYADLYLQVGAEVWRRS